MFVISLVIMAVLVAADQLIKLAVTNNLPLNGQPVEVIKFGSFKVFSLTHISMEHDVRKDLVSYRSACCRTDRGGDLYV